MIQRGDPVGAEALRQGDHTRVGAAERAAGVPVDEFGDAAPVGLVQVLNDKFTRRERAEEGRLGSRTELSRDEVARLGDHQPGRDERFALLREKAGARRMVRIVGVGRGQDDTRVDDQRRHVRPKPSASMASASRAVRPVLDAPSATKPGRRPVAARSAGADRDRDRCCGLPSCGG